jgi:PPE-repeat protein
VGGRAPSVDRGQPRRALQLLSTNVFGQNSAAIAATEAIYAQMWAEDASAMNQYQVSSRAATAAIVPFQPPPATTRPHTGPATPSRVQSPPNHPPLPAVHASSGGPVHTSSGAPTAGPGAASVPTGDGISTIFGMDPTSMASVLVSAAGFGAMAATNAANRPLPMMVGALGDAMAAPVGVASTAGGAAGMVLAAGPADTAPLLASTADGHVMGGLSVPPTWDAGSPTSAPRDPWRRHLAMLVIHHRWRCPLGSRHRPATDGNGGAGRTHSLTTSGMGGRLRRFCATIPLATNTHGSWPGAASLAL